ncbi:MAG: polysaccharide deacetylase family protein [Pseudomonadota bacterium]
MPNFGSERIARFLPRSLITTTGRSWQRRLYLTFDDGPHPEVTPQVSALLKRHGIAGSFFCIGTNLERHPEIARQLIADGHILCNHSYSHKNYRRMMFADQLDDLTACADALRNAGSSSDRVFRAPQGQLSLQSILRLRKNAWRIVHWSYDSLDYRKPTTGELVGRFEEAPVRPGDIVLFHDDDEVCVRALEQLIPIWLEQQFSFGTVSELTAASAA